MKLRKNITKVVLFALVISLFAGIACADKNMATITGVVEQTDAGFIIMTADGEYTAAGADLVALVGKKIEATGKITEGEAGKVINVVAIKEVKE